MLNSAEHEIYPAYKCQLTFMSRINVNFDDYNIKFSLNMVILIFMSNLEDVR